MPFLPYDQNQSYLFPPHLNDWVTDYHPARVFSDLVDKLPVAGFKNAAVGEKSGHFYEEPPVKLGFLWPSSLGPVPSGLMLVSSFYSSCRGHVHVSESELPILTLGPSTWPVSRSGLLRQSGSLSLCTALRSSARARQSPVACAPAPSGPSTSRAAPPVAGRTSQTGSPCSAPCRPTRPAPSECSGYHPTSGVPASDAPHSV